MWKKEDRRKEVLQNAGVDIGSLLTSGMVLKEDRQKAETILSLLYLIIFKSHY